MTTEEVRSYITLSDPKGDDIRVYDSRPYHVHATAPGMDAHFVGWFSAAKSGLGYLYFSLEDNPGHITVLARRVRSVEEVEA